MNIPPSGGGTEKVGQTGALLTPDQEDSRKEQRDSKRETMWNTVGNPGAEWRVADHSVAHVMGVVDGGYQQGASEVFTKVSMQKKIALNI